MSHIAAGLVQRRRVGAHASKAVLLFMAGCASDDGTGIWTSKANIAADLEMSKRTVQRAVDDLCAAGLISEIGQRKCRHGYTVEYRIDLVAVEKLPSTRPESEGRSGKSTGDTVTPHAKGTTTCSGDTMSPVTPRHPRGDTVTPQGVTPCHPNLTGTIPEPLCAEGGAHTQDMDGVGEPEIDAVLARFIEVYPRIGDREKTREALGAALGAGVPAVTILAAARAYADEQRGNARQYIAYSENWLAQRRWERHAEQAGKAAPDPAEVARRQVEAIRSGKTYLCTMISAARGRDLVAQGLVSAADCRAVGIEV